MVTTATFPILPWNSGCRFHHVTSQSLPRIHWAICFLVYCIPFHPYPCVLNTQGFLGLLLFCLLSTNDFPFILHFSPTHFLDTYTFSSPVTVLTSKSKFYLLFCYLIYSGTPNKTNLDYLSIYWLNYKSFLSLCCPRFQKQN